MMRRSSADGGGRHHRAPRPGRLVVLATAAAGLTAAVLGPAPADAVGLTTVRVNVPDPTIGQAQANHHTDDTFEGAMSGDGRYVVFTSKASNLVAADTDHETDLFLRDRKLATTELINVSTGGEKGNHDLPMALDVTPDGRYVVFASDADNLVAGDVNRRYDVFVRDRKLGTTELVSHDLPGLPGGPGADGHSGYDNGGASISDNGRYVAFQSAATDLVAGDTNAAIDIFVRDRKAATTERISLTNGGGQALDNSFRPRMSSDSRWVVYTSYAALDPADDTPGQADVYLHDRAKGTTELVSVALDGTAGDLASRWGRPSDDGRFVVFQSEAGDLDPADDNAVTDVYLRDRASGTTSLLVVEGDDTAPDLGAWLPTMSGDAGMVLFGSASPDLVAGDTNGVGDVFVLHVASGAIRRVSVATNGAESNHWSNPVAVSEDGRRMAFMSYADNLVANDTNVADDVFVREPGWRLRAP